MKIERQTLCRNWDCTTGVVHSRKHSRFDCIDRLSKNMIPQPERERERERERRFSWVSLPTLKTEEAQRTKEKPRRGRRRDKGKERGERGREKL